MKQSFTVLCLGLEAMKTSDVNIYGYDVLKHYENISKNVCILQGQENTFISKYFAYRHRASL